MAILPLRLSIEGVKFKFNTIGRERGVLKGINAEAEGVKRNPGRGNVC